MSSSQGRSSGTILTCRGCLAVGVKLYSIKQNRLVDNYVQLVGISVKDKYTQLLCSICVTMLLKFAAFRDKCSRSYQLLVAAEKGKSIRRSKLPYTLTETQVLEYVGINDNQYDFLSEVIPSHQTKDNEDSSATKEILLNNTETAESKDNIVRVKQEIKTEHFETLYVVEIESVVDGARDYNIKQEKTDDETAVDKKYHNVANEEIDDDSTDEDMDDNAQESEEEVGKKTKKQIIKPTTDEETIEFGKTYGFNIKFLTEEEQYEEIELKKGLSGRRSTVKCEQCGQSCSTQSLLKKHYVKCHNESYKFVCKFCQSRYSNKNFLTKHLNMHKIVFYCKQCPQTTKRVAFLPPHYLSHKGKKYKCEYCDRVFSKKKSYTSHVRFQHASILPWCDLCSVSFINDTVLTCHKNKEHSGLKADFSCEECSAKFCSNEALGRHVGQKQCGRASCVRCGEGFLTEQMLRFHLICHQGDATEYACKECGVNFNNLIALKRHAKACGNAIPCVQCGRHFEDDAAMLEHVTSEHNAANGFKCPECGKMYPNPVNYKSHISTSHDLEKHLKRLLETGTDKVLECNKCQEPFNNVSEYKIHLKSHKDAIRYECDYCHTQFKIKYELKLHMLSHTGEKVFKCNMCTRSFFTNRSLKAHMSAHSDVRPYQCEICKNCYKKKMHLKMHQIIHSDVKPYACTQCEWRFKTPSELKMHSAKHSDEKPHKCEYCEQRFKYSDVLTKHLFRHTGARPYKCTECTESYNRRLALKTHLKNVHGMEMPRGRTRVKNVKSEGTSK